MARGREAEMKISDRHRHDDKWDHMTDSSGKTYWVDKVNQRVHEVDHSIRGTLLGDMVGPEDKKATKAVFGKK